MRDLIGSGIAINLLFVLLFAPACVQQHYPDPYEQQESIERPAQSLEEEESAPNKAGKIVVVILVIGAAVGAIVAPLLIFLL